MFNIFKSTWKSFSFTTNIFFRSSSFLSGFLFCSPCLVTFLEFIYKSRITWSQGKNSPWYIFLSRMIITTFFPTRYESLGICVVLFVEFCTKNICFLFFLPISLVKIISLLSLILIIIIMKVFEYIQC